MELYDVTAGVRSERVNTKDGKPQNNSVYFQSQEAAARWRPLEDEDFQTLSEKNQWMTLWYRQKCLQDKTFCI